MLLQELVKRQRALGETDRQFALRLGLPKVTWQMTRQGTRRLGRRVVACAAQAFPDLREQAASFLLSEATSVADDDTTEEVAV